VGIFSGVVRGVSLVAGGGLGTFGGDEVDADEGRCAAGDEFGYAGWCGGVKVLVED
jgi:hypothetical protein